MSVDEAILELMAPTVKRLVREEVKRAGLEWRWAPVPRVAELLGMTENAVRHRVRAGQFPGRNIDGRVYVDLLELSKRIERLE